MVLDKENISPQQQFAEEPPEIVHVFFPADSTVSADRLAIAKEATEEDLDATDQNAAMAISNWMRAARFADNRRLEAVEKEKSSRWITTCSRIAS